MSSAPAPDCHVRSQPNRLVRWSLDHPGKILGAAALISLVLLAGFVRLQVDTDPENMLAGDDPVRVRNAEVREQFGTGETIVLGLTADGLVDRPGAIDDAVALHGEIVALDGVVAEATVSPATAAAAPDDPTSRIDPATIVERVAADPLLGGNVLTDDGDTIAFFVSLEAKDDARPVASAMERLVDDHPALADAEVAIAGLPLAQEAFGAQMFIQMGVFAPLAGLFIFALLWVFFRRLALVGPAMVLALVVVIWTMGALVGSGNTLHIMSSMIPIFLMPIAILDGVHILSEYHDLRGRAGSAPDARRRTLETVYAELGRPIAFTSLTTAVGFASLAFVPIPPVRVFGIFISMGVALAWLGTMTVLPALMVVREERAGSAAPRQADPNGVVARIARAMVGLGGRRRTAVLLGFAALALMAVPAVAQIQVNDNPVRWFRADHEVRQASEALNDALPGTFVANYVLAADDPELLTDPRTVAAVEALEATWADLGVVGTVASYTDLAPGATGDDLAAGIDGARTMSPLVRTLIDDEARTANLRLQLRSGDNQAMQATVDATEAALARTPLPAGVDADWAGEAYLNLVWQDKMVTGMIGGFAGTLVVVFALLVLLFRSVRWAVLGIAPVLWTVLIVYGLIGAIGKDLDMPIAVLSTLVLGIGVDFAIHFIERFRELVEECGSIVDAVARYAEEPARALTRNALVIAIGFAPLFASSLTPYVVVGAFLSGIIVLSWVATLVALPAAVSQRTKSQTATATPKRTIVVRSASADRRRATRAPA